MKANAKLVDYQSTLSLARKWGGGEVASADGMRFVTPIRTINAGPNRKYFGSCRGITWYNFLSDQFSGFHGIVVPGTLRDSIFVLEGLLEQQTGLNPIEVMTDTAGASDMVFGLFWLLGYQFSPRLSDAGESVFWRVDKEANYGALNDLARNCAHPQKIEHHWEDMMRIAGSLKLGTVQASDLIRSLLKSDRPSSLAQAIIEAGRINKTLYLLNYVDDEDYRRRILTQLNRGEGRHAVARAICHGQRGEIRKRYREGQEDQFGVLGLVTNALVLWNTIYMQAALDHLRQRGEEVKEEDEARLSPLSYKHVNMLGHYSFTLAEQVLNGQLRPLKQPSELDEWPIAVGIPITGHPPHRSRRARFAHRAPTLGVWRQNVRLATVEERAVLVATHQQFVPSVPIASDLFGFAAEACAARGQRYDAGRHSGSGYWSAPHGKQRIPPPPAVTIALAVESTGASSFVAPS